MSRLDTYELTHPESLSEHQLCEILKNSCIENLKFEKLGRSEMLEMYKRIAMPLPQRHRNENAKSSTTVGMISEKFVASMSDNDTHSLAAGWDKGNKRILQTSHPQTDRLKSPINDQKPMNKKIRLYSTPKIEVGYNGIYKRNCEEPNEETSKKRQRITWP